MTGPNDIEDYMGLTTGTRLHEWIILELIRLGFAILLIYLSCWLCFLATHIGFALLQSMILPFVPEPDVPTFILFLMGMQLCLAILLWLCCSLHVWFIGLLLGNAALYLLMDFGLCMVVVNPRIWAEVKD
jgi:hypothetical protein